MSADRRVMLAKVHVARKALALEEDSYRALVQRVTGHLSAGECTPSQLDALLGEFKRLGFKPKAAKTKRSASPQARMIHALWAEIAPTLRVAGDPDAEARALRQFVQRQTVSRKSPAGVGSVAWLDSHQANRVIEGLKAWHARVVGTDRAAAPAGETVAP